MKIKKYIVFTSIAIYILCGCTTNNTKAPDNNEHYLLSESFKQKIEFEEVIKQPVTEEIYLTGTIEANPDKVVPFVSLASGIVSKTNFSLGDEVHRGQVLAELQSTELRSLESELNNLNTKIQVAKQQLHSSQVMFEDGISSQKDLLNAESELSILNSEKQKVVSNLSHFNASSEKGVFQIKAPSSGIITEKSISAGTQISAEGEPLFTITDLTEVWTMIDIYVSNVSHIETGMDVNISTLSYPETEFYGKINAISQVLDSEANVLKARVVLQNKDMKLKPGMLVDIVALKDKGTKAIRIPTKSLIFDDNQNFVVTFNNDSTMEIRNVEVLSKNNGSTYIASGLNENESIVTINHLLIYEQIKN